MKNILSLVLIMVLTAGSAVAQAPNDKPKRSEWGKKMVELKHEKIIKETEMTDAQKEQFMPLYEAMGKEIYQVNREARELERKISAKQDATDDEYLQAAETMRTVKAKECEIEAKYFEKFEKILSKKQLFQLKRAENNFTRDVLNNKKEGGKKRERISDK